MPERPRPTETAAGCLATPYAGMYSIAGANS